MSHTSTRRDPRRRQRRGGRRRRPAPLLDFVGVATCRLCGCTDDDCSPCVERTGSSCRWVAPDLCSACAGADEIVTSIREVLSEPGATFTLADLDAVLESYRGEGEGHAG